MTDARRKAAEALRQARQWMNDWAPNEAYEPGENHTHTMATQEWIDKALAAIEAELARPAANTGHGHVRPRPDGVRARCGGPAICSVCAREKAELARVPEDLMRLIQQLDNVAQNKYLNSLSLVEVLHYKSPAETLEGKAADALRSLLL